MNSQGVPLHVWANAEKVYNALLRQGRPEPDARRDAERWIEGNLGYKIVLPVPKSQPHSAGRRGSHSAADQAVAEEVDAWLRQQREQKRKRDEWSRTEAEKRRREEYQKQERREREARTQTQRETQPQQPEQKQPPAKHGRRRSRRGKTNKLLLLVTGLLAAGAIYFAATDDTTRATHRAAINTQWETLQESVRTRLSDAPHDPGIEDRDTFGALASDGAESNAFPTPVWLTPTPFPALQCLPEDLGYCACWPVGEDVNNSWPAFAGPCDEVPGLPPPTPIAIDFGEAGVMYLPPGYVPPPGWLTPTPVPTSIPTPTPTPVPNPKVCSDENKGHQYEVYRDGTTEPVYYAGTWLTCGAHLGRPQPGPTPFPFPTVCQYGRLWVVDDGIRKPIRLGPIPCEVDEQYQTPFKAPPTLCKENGHAYSRLPDGSEAIINGGHYWDNATTLPPCDEYEYEYKEDP